MMLFLPIKFGQVQADFNPPKLPSDGTDPSLFYSQNLHLFGQNPD